MQTITTNNKKWFVVTTKPRAEKQISKRLSAIRIEHYLPLQKQLRQWHDRKKWVEQPLFTGYLFVKTEEQLRSRVFEVGGILKYLSFNGVIATVPEQEIRRIRQLCAAAQPVTVQQGRLSEGDEVEIIAGQLSGLRGRLIQAGEQQKIRIAIPSLGCFATVEIDKELVHKTTG